MSDYDSGDCFCEMQSQHNQPHLSKITKRLDGLDISALRRRARDAERELFNLGVTFTVYTDRDAIDRILPFDVIPRVLSKQDWATIESGVKQRVAALNLFLHDIYHDGHILKDGIIPAQLVKGNKNYRPEMQGVDVPQGTYVHICGTDLVRNENGTFLVLEDNGRCPSGVSYVLENRHLMMRAFPDLADGIPIADVDAYGSRLARAMSEVAPQNMSDPTIVLLSPGIYNSAYFEHVFLAREMGVQLVEGRDLLVEDDTVFMRTTSGKQRVDVIYRRIDDAYLDPESFHRDSALGVPRRHVFILPVGSR